MEALAIVDSGNYAFSFCRALERKGYVFEVVSTPCQIAHNGCGYCIKFPLEFKDFLISEGQTQRIPVRAIYSIEKMMTRNRYERIY